MSFILYILGIFSALSAFILSFPFYNDIHLLFGGLLFICLLQYILYYALDNKKYFYIISISLFFICLYFSWTGLFYIKDVILKKYMEVSIYHFSLTGTYNYYKDFFMTFLTMLSLLLPINMCNIYFLDIKKYELSIVILFPFIFCEILFTITPPYYCLPYIAYCLILVFLKHQSKIQLLPIILCVSLLFGLFYFNPPHSYTHPRKKYGNMSSEISIPGEESTHYDLMEQGNRYYSNRVDLIVYGIKNHSFLLRGNIYNDFDGEWKQENDLYIDEYPYLGNLRKLNDKFQGKTKKIIVSDNYHKDIVYVPYYFKPTSQMPSYYFSHFEGSKDEAYELIIPNKKWNNYLDLDGSSKWKDIENIDEFESKPSYTSTENSHIPDDTREVLLRFMEENDLDEITDINELVIKAKKAIHDNTEYSLTPGKTPKEENFFDYFLYKNKKGYCVHYASTLALIIRLSGYEANFVTGYQVDGSLSSSDNTSVYDYCQHAWVEVEDSLLGNIPVEATPPSSTTTHNQNDNSQTTSDPTDHSNDDLDNNDQTLNQEEVNKEIVIPTYFYMFIGFIMIVIGIYVQSRLRLHNRYNHLDNNQKTCMMYYCLDKLEITISIEMIDLVKKAKFSQYQLNEEEYQKVLSIYTQLIDEFYNNSSIIKKIKLKIIDAYI